jgi:acetylornithine deacetylase/succinyl-diaminopimelate desuccinylase-like protein
MNLAPWPIDGIVVGEPTANRMIVAHKANGCFELLCTGRAVHGARPETGCNAIYRMTDLVGFLRTTVIPGLQAHIADGFAGSTLSVNMIDGGTKSNIVADRCTAVLDLRVVPGHGTPEEVMNAIVEQATRELGFDVSLEWSHCTPGLLTDCECTLAQAVRDALLGCNADPAPGTVSYCTDGGVFSQMGYDSIVLGPGDIRQAHGAVEYVSVDQLQQAVDIYAAIAYAMIERSRKQ